MKKIISVCLCICLMSGCGKLLSHGRPANAVAEDKGSEVVPTHSLTSDTSNASASEPSNTPAPEPSNTPVPIPEPQSLSDSDVSSSQLSWYWLFPTINVSNSVLYWTLNSVGYAVALALAIVVGYDVFRYFKPIKVITPKPEPAGDITLNFNQADYEDYEHCCICHRSDISYTWYLAKRKIKRYFWADIWNKKIDSKILVYELCCDNKKYGTYVYKLET
ncbi:hypothetical protein [Candidatus Endomicrobiellum agilis]|uniref:hypothetical protein n=1 Tax=Candidatus Endomicrobiellum agilis TaxID=3238957 RepID=UPI00358971BC|nr:hypothetical protein [Endomicrobium sp.]